MSNKKTTFSEAFPQFAHLDPEKCAFIARVMGDRAISEAKSQVYGIPININVVADETNSDAKDYQIVIDHFSSLANKGG